VAVNEYLGAFAEIAIGIDGAAEHLEGDVRNIERDGRSHWPMTKFRVMVSK
jgi:hypothetical protein